MTDKLNPAAWLATALSRTITTKLSLAGVTDWISGAQAPTLPGQYERLYTDGVYLHFFDGEHWRAEPDSPPHWHQVGAYPCWRGLRNQPKRMVSVQANEGDTVLVLRKGAHYKLGHPIEEVIAAHILADVKEVSWCSASQGWF